MVFHSLHTHRLFVTIILFPLLSYDWVILKMSLFQRFFSLDLSYVNVFYWSFHFIDCSLQLQNLFLVLFLWFLFVLVISLCSSFPDFVEVSFLCFLVAPLQICRFWVCMTRNYCDPLMVSCFLKVLCCYFCRWSSSYLFWSLLIDLGRELPLTTLLVVFRLSQTFYRHACYTLLFPSCAKILKIVWLLLILHHSPRADNLSFVFKSPMLMFAFLVCRFGQLSVCAH